MRRSAFFSRGEGIVNADSALNSVTGKGSNARVLNWIYPKMLITAYINLAFFFFCLNLSVIHSAICACYIFCRISKGLFFSGLRHRCNKHLLCDSLYIMTLWSQPTVKVGSHYSIFELPGDIRTKESFNELHFTE